MGIVDYYRKPDMKTYFTKPTKTTVPIELMQKQFEDELQYMIANGELISVKDLCKKLGKRHNYLQKIKAPWAQEMHETIKQLQADQKQKKKDTLKQKFTEALKNMIDQGEEPNESKLCRYSGVSTSYLRSASAPWVNEIRTSLKIAYEAWEKHGGKTYKEFKVILNAYIKEGKRPQIYPICKDVMKVESYLHDAPYPWQKKLRKEIEEADKQWQETGGADYKKLKAILEKFIASGKRPQLNPILREAKKGYNYLHEDIYPWHKKLKSEIEEADKNWQETGGSDYKKIQQELNKIIKAKNVEPNVKAVLQMAGFKPSYLLYLSFPWQAKIKAKIEHAKEDWRKQKVEAKRLSEMVETEKEKHLMTLHVDCETPEQLYERFIAKGEKINAYKHIGIQMILVKPTILSRLMYAVSKGSWINIKIDPSTFQPARKPLVDACIKIAFRDKAKSAQRKIETIYNAIHYCTHHAIPLPLNIEDARTFYKEYSKHLTKEFHIGRPTKTASVKQDRIRELIQTLYPHKKTYEWIIQRIPSVPRGEVVSMNIDMDEGGYALSFYFSLFHQLADFLLKELPMPHVMHFNDKRLLIAPFGRAVIHHEDNQDNRHLWDYYKLDQIRLATMEEAINASSHRRTNDVSERIEKLSLKIESANQSMNHPSKRQLMNLCIKTFMLLLSGMTGQTEATLQNAEWEGDDEFKVDKTGIKRLVTLKPRANYRRFAFPLHRTSVNALRKYLKLRQIFLQGDPCKYLFPPQIKFNSATTSLLSINPHLTNIGTMKLRDMYNKIILHVSGGDLMLTANILGNSPTVNLKHYNDNPKSLIERQLGHSFIPSMVKAFKDNTNKSTIKTPQSSCSDYENGESYEDGKELDCKNMFACFFCKHFCTHPIREDIHKLSSLLYIVIFYTSGRAKGDVQQYEEVLKPVEKVINRILEIMISDYGAEKMVKEIEELVFKKGILTPYWQRQFEMLKEIGAY